MAIYSELAEQQPELFTGQLLDACRLTADVAQAMGNQEGADGIRAALEHRASAA
ncbi:hypothetical protein ACQPZF_02895 [Actinosynnema sp. CS-041913]|uniref:hypothetical protein n=1 Tax=Actinosynnema sp. CS-041913 TaxID=3239917 RepID=UPI003D8A28B1